VEAAAADAGDFAGTPDVTDLQVMLTSMAEQQHVSISLEMRQAKSVAHRLCSSLARASLLRCGRWHIEQQAVAEPAT